MFGKSFVSTAVIALGFGIWGMGGAAQAQTPTLIKKTESWGAYSYKANTGTVCYALSVPVKKEPETLNHGDVFFMVSKRADGSISFEPQFMAGYTLKEKSRVTVTIGDKNFDLFTKDTSAWVDIGKTDVEAALIAAMRGGSTMTVKAVSLRGNNTSYVYSLKGVTAALNTVKSCN